MHCALQYIIAIILGHTPDDVFFATPSNRPFSWNASNQPFPTQIRLWLQFRCRKTSSVAILIRAVHTVHFY